MLELRGYSAGRARLGEESWRKRPEDPLLRILWADELRLRGRRSEALTIEIDVATKSFDNFDPARSLSIAKEGLANSDAGTVERSRALLERLARIDPRRRTPSSVVMEAAQLLRGRRPGGN